MCYTANSDILVGWKTPYN